MKLATQAVEAILADELTRRGTVSVGWQSYCAFSDEPERSLGPEFEAIIPAYAGEFIVGPADAGRVRYFTFVGGTYIASGMSSLGMIVETSLTTTRVNSGTISAYTTSVDTWREVRSPGLGEATAQLEKWQAERAARPSEPTFLDQSEQVILELGRLEDGWDGQAGEAPTIETVRTLASSVAAFPASTERPDVEVDGSDGSVSLRWYSEGTTAVLTTHILGDRTTVTVTSRNRELYGRTFAKGDITHLSRALLDCFEQLRHG